MEEVNTSKQLGKHKNAHQRNTIIPNHTLKYINTNATRNRWKHAMTEGEGGGGGGAGASRGLTQEIDKVGGSNHKQHERP